MFRRGKNTKRLDEQQKKGISLVSATKPKSVIAEQYRTIRTNIQFSMVDKELKCFVVTSSGPFEEKSTISGNIANVYADQGKRVLLVDADLRKPNVNRSFNLPNTVGLTSLLTNSDIKIFETVHQIENSNLFVMTSGPVPPNPSELLDSNRMNQIIVELNKLFDIVIYDMPPVTSVTDAQIMATKTDGVLFVVRRGIAAKDGVLLAKQLLDRVQAKVLGVVFNGAEMKKDKSYGYGYGYGYGFAEGEEQ